MFLTEDQATTPNASVTGYGDVKIGWNSVP